jgi:hypothetical protein
MCLPLSAQAATINMILSDMDVTYLGSAANNTGALYDSIAHPGGNLNAAEADEVKTAVFEVDTTHVGTLMTAPNNVMSADFRVNGVGPTIPLNSFLTNLGSNGNGFGFDWFQGNNNLRLGINSVDLLLTNNVFFFTGTATILSQSLPFGLAFAPGNVAFSFTATLPSLNGVNPASNALGSGALTISGEQIPEPGTIGMLGAGALILAIGLAWRRDRSMARIWQT